MTVWSVAGTGHRMLRRLLKRVPPGMPAGMPKRARRLGDPA